MQEGNETDAHIGKPRLGFIVFALVVVVKQDVPALFADEPGIALPRIADQPIPRGHIGIVAAQTAVFAKRGRVIPKPDTGRDFHAFALLHKRQIRRRQRRQFVQTLHRNCALGQPGHDLFCRKWGKHVSNFQADFGSLEAT